MDCEEKMLAFQIFILECSRAQDTLKKMITEDPDTLCNVKFENIEDFDKNHIADETPEVGYYYYYYLNWLCFVYLVLHTIIHSM